MATETLRLLIADDHPMFRKGLRGCWRPSPAWRWWAMRQRRDAVALAAHHSRI
jgi:hypothetical protein